MFHYRSLDPHTLSTHYEVRHSYAKKKNEKEKKRKEEKNERMEDRKV